ncbi:hypothetical protein GCM10027072_23590 [Streptomyces bullii]
MGAEPAALRVDGPCRRTGAVARQAQRAADTSAGRHIVRADGYVPRVQRPFGAVAGGRHWRAKSAGLVLR